MRQSRAEIYLHFVWATYQRIRNQLLPGELFGWQDGYAVFSFSRSHRERVVAYIRNQKEHHATGAVWDAWE